MEAGWLAERGPGPYLLDRPGATYVLETDVATSGTAFVIAAGDVTLDLNGHTITYNNAPPIVVPNGGFEADPVGSAVVTGWELSGAPRSRIEVAQNDVFLFGSRVLRWTVSDGAGPQVIRSSQVAIPRADRTYTASITPSGLTLTRRGVTLKLEVVDAATDRVESSFTRADSNIWQGDAAAFSFVPATTDPVYLRVTAELSDGVGDVTFTLDRAAISPSLNYGVLAAHADPWLLAFEFGNNASGGLLVSGVQNLPASIRSVYRDVNAPTIVDRVGTGRIRQGQSAGVACHAINVRETGGPLRIRGITIETRGDDTIPILARRTYPNPSPSDARTISDCTIDYPASGLNITRRSCLYAAINVEGMTPATVERCTINRNPQVGILAGGASERVVHTIRDNVLHPNAMVTNGYGIMLLGPRVRVLNNTINTGDRGSSMGIGLDGALSEVEVAGNKVDVRYAPNREYGMKVPVRAFRLRNLGAGVISGINVHDNVFSARTGLGWTLEAIGARLDAIPEGSRHIRLDHNQFKAIVEGAADPGTQHRATALVIDSCRMTGDELVLQENRFESDDTGIRLGYSDAPETEVVRRVLFRNNEIRKSSDGVLRPFASLILGYWVLPLSDIVFYGTTFTNGATDAITWAGRGPKQVDLGRELSVTVLDAMGNGIPGASIRAIAGDGSMAGASVTDARGTSILDVVTTRFRGTTTLHRSTREPLTLHVTREGFRSSAIAIKGARDDRIRVQLDRE
jgi:hypothetical protein